MAQCYEDESAQLDSYRFNLALARGAELKGANIIHRDVTGFVTSGTTISGVQTASGEIHCGTVVVAAGTWSRAFTPWLGFPVPVRPMKGERLLLNYPGEPPACADQLSQTRSHDQPYGRSHQRRQHRRT